MLVSPKPTKLCALVEEVDVAKHRNLFCVWYDRCLDEAVDGSWASFTCEKCPLFKAAWSGPPALA
ncbi:MAG TPA: hypothetical protein VMK12_32415 [Anaeromyxobacteraceae bacterium]|nr:hypothetical protein [Anaeromyxobacteraceae bacterium]